VTATLSDVSRTDVSVQAEFTLPQAPTGGGTFVTLGGRQIGADGYRTTLVVESTGAMTLRLDRLVGGTETILGTQRLPGSYVPGTSLTVRFEVAGTGTATLRAKAWSTGAAEPAEWTLTRGDDAPQLQWPGALYLRTYASGSATTSSTLHVDNVRAEPPGTVVQQPNSAPTADFTATQAGLSVAFDGSSSTDPDGSIAAHGWAFGDGATATGATATHAYASAGTYTVVLTVTDDGGATATRERTVTVTAPAPDPGTGTPPLAADAFAREVASGWGAADVGGAWTVNGTLSNASVTAGAGQLISAPGRTMRAVLPDVSRQDVAVQVDVMLPQAPSGGGTFVTLGTQRVGTTDYRSTLVFQGTGSVVLRVERTVDGAATVLGSTTLPQRYVPGTSVTVRFETSGTGTTTLRSKVWATGTAEPAEWALTRTDSTAALQRAGALVLETYASSSATAAATVRIDNLWAGAAGTTPATP
jgi:PKD repeat protein